MKRQVNTYNALEGYHAYPDAPESCAYLGARHRHIFVIRGIFEVAHNNRDIEINQQQSAIEDALVSEFGRPCEYGGRSCEDIAEFLMGVFPTMVECQVLEDGYGGATLAR